MNKFSLLRNTASTCINHVSAANVHGNDIKPGPMPPFLVVTYSFTGRYVMSQITGR